MTTQIGTIESEVELVDDRSAPAGGERELPFDERTRRQLQAKRERALRARIHAEGFSD